MAPFVGTLHIRPIRIILDFQCRIIFPCIRITYFHMESSQFLQSFHFGRIAHPSKVFDAFTQAFLQVLHQSHHTFFGCGREIFLYIHLAYRFTQSRTYSADRSLPTRLHFLRTAHGTLIKIEVLFGHSIIQSTCGSINQFPLQIETLLLKRKSIQNFCSSLQRSGLTYDNFLHIF